MAIAGVTEVHSSVHSIHIHTNRLTNNAVEQTLYGVLDVFEEAGIDYKGKLLRLGMASAAFARKYPDACEDRVQIKLLASLTSQLQTVSADISKLEAHLKEIQSYEKLQNT